MISEKIEQKVNDGLLSKRKHPTLDLWIYNYTPECQFSQKWDEITLMCRGLILDQHHQIVARPFSKFFNYTESPHQNLLYKVISEQQPFVVSEKMDGSLGIVSWYNGQWIVATRGSFESEQAIRAQKFVEDLNWEVFEKESYENVTFLFEIIYKDNRIVLDYQDFEGLVLLSIVFNENGSEMSPIFVQEIAGKLGCRYPETYMYKKLTDILEDINTPLFKGKEGVVVCWHQYNSAPFRIKIKTEEYVLLHKVITQINEHRIWETLKDSKEKELESILPDEIYEWYNSIVVQLHQNYNMIYQQVLSDYNSLMQSFKDRTRKELALEILKNHKYPHISFRLLDGKIITEQIWNLIEPKII